MHNKIAEALKNAVAGSNAVANIATVGDSSVSVSSASILEVCRFLKTNAEFEFNVLQVITGTDYLSTNEIEVSYVLASFTKNTELILKTRVGRGTVDGTLESLPKLNSVVSVWSAANFQERECYDMIGVNFTGHPDLRRVLCPYDWQGHPLRRDYVVQETYQGMTVNPPNKVNTEDHFFGKKLKEELGDPKQVSWSWKDDSETSAKEGE
jgi:NADH-quinone oxidoreductase subunit C